MFKKFKNTIASKIKLKGNKILLLETPAIGVVLFKTGIVILKNFKAISQYKNETAAWKMRTKINLNNGGRLCFNIDDTWKIIENPPKPKTAQITDSDAFSRPKTTQAFVTSRVQTSGKNIGVKRKNVERILIIAENKIV